MGEGDGYKYSPGNWPGEVMDSIRKHKGDIDQTDVDITLVEYRAEQAQNLIGNCTEPTFETFVHRLLTKVPLTRFEDFLAQVPRGERLFELYKQFLKQQIERRDTVDVEEKFVDYIFSSSWEN